MLCRWPCELQESQLGVVRWKSWVPTREGVVSSQVGGRGREMVLVWYRQGIIASQMEEVPVCARVLES